MKRGSRSHVGLSREHSEQSAPQGGWPRAPHATHSFCDPEDSTHTSVSRLHEVTPPSSQQFSLSCPQGGRQVPEESSSPTPQPVAAQRQFLNAHTHCRIPYDGATVQHTKGIPTWCGRHVGEYTKRATCVGKAIKRTKTSAPGSWVCIGKQQRLPWRLTFMEMGLASWSGSLGFRPLRIQVCRHHAIHQQSCFATVGVLQPELCCLYIVHCQYSCLPGVRSTVFWHILYALRGDISCDCYKCNQTARHTTWGVPEFTTSDAL